MRLLSEGSVYAFATFAPVLTGLLVTPFVTRMLGNVEYGHVALGVSIYQICGVLLALGLPASVTRHAVIERSGPRGAVGIIVGAVPISVVLAALGVGGALTFGGAGEGGRGTVIAVAIVAALGMSTTSLVLSHLRAVSRVRAFVTLAICQAWAAPALGLVIVASVPPTGAAYLVGVAVAQIAIAGAGLLVVVARDRPLFSRPEWLAAFRIGAPTVPHQFAMVAASSLLVIVATWLWGSARAGELQLAVLVGSLPVVVVGAFNNSWAPMVYRVAPEHRADAIAGSSGVMSALAATVSCGVALLAPVALAIIGEPAMRTAEAVAASAVIAAAGPVMVLYLANIHLVFASGRTSLLALTTPLALAMAYSAALGLAAIGGDGAVWALACAVPLFYVVQVFLATWLRKRTGSAVLRLRSSCVWAFATAAICTGVAATNPGIPTRVGLATLVAAAAALLLERRRRFGWPG